MISREIPRTRKIAGTPILISGSHSGIEVWEWYGSGVSHYWRNPCNPENLRGNPKVRFQSSVNHPDPVFWLQFCREFSRVYKFFIEKIPPPRFWLIIPIKNGLGLPGGCFTQWTRLKVPRWSEAWLSMNGFIWNSPKNREVEGSGFLKTSLSPNLEKFR